MIEKLNSILPYISVVISLGLGIISLLLIRQKSYNAFINKRDIRNQKNEKN